MTSVYSVRYALTYRQPPRLLAPSSRLSQSLSREREQATERFKAVESELSNLKAALARSLQGEETERRCSERESKRVTVLSEELEVREPREKLSVELKIEDAWHVLGCISFLQHCVASCAPFHKWFCCLLMYVYATGRLPRAHSSRGRASARQGRVEPTAG